jgi:glutaminyl-tRNA synthetase
MGAYIIKYQNAVLNDDGSVKEIHCTADIETGNGMPVDGRKVKGTIHWLSAKDTYSADVVLYENLLTLEDPSKLPDGMEYTDFINPNSKTVKRALLEPSLKESKAGDKFQFVRLGYFCRDTKNEDTFNSTVSLKDSKGK